MPKYKIGYSYGYVGTDHEDIIEADSQESAERLAWEEAVAGLEVVAQLEIWAEEITDEDSA